MFKLSLGSGIPLYLQIEELVLKNIKNGVWKEGDKLLPETELAKELNVNRLTLREAFNSLIRQGYLVRVHGKGVFVKNPLNENKTIWNLNIVDTYEGKKNALSFHKVISFRKEKPNKYIAKILNINEDVEIFYIERLRIEEKDDSIIGIERSYLPVQFCPNLNEEILSKSKYHYLETLGIKAQKIDRFLSPIVLNPLDRKLLNLTKDDIGLKVESTTYLENDIVLEYSETIYNANKYKFLVTAYR